MRHPPVNCTIALKGKTSEAPRVSRSHTPGLGSATLSIPSGCTHGAAWLWLVTSKALRGAPWHSLPLALGIGLVQMNPGARAVILGVLGLLLGTLKVILLFSCLGRGQGSLWRCQCKCPGPEALYMHTCTHTLICIFLSSQIC